MNTKRITEGAIFLAIYTVMLLIFLYVPIIGTFISVVIPVPFIYYTAKYNWKNGLLFFAGAAVISVIVGTPLSLPTALIFGLTGVVFGWGIHNNKDRLTIFIAATLTFLINIIIQYGASIILFDMNIIQETADMFKESVDQSVAMMESLGQEVPTEILTLFNNMAELIITLLPSLFVMLSVFMTLIIQSVSFPIVKRIGIEIHAAKPFHEITLPKSIVWYYLIVLLVSLIVTMNEGSFLYNAVINLIYILETLFILQGITFIFFYGHKKNLSKSVPVFITVISLLVPIFTPLIRILGIIDIGFGLRHRIYDKN